MFENKRTSTFYRQISSDNLRAGVKISAGQIMPTVSSLITPESVS
jgi:hypothetical protein